MASPAAERPRARLHVVTGKGGTGKTTVAAALALALAEGGQRVLLAEVEGRQAIASLFAVESLGYDERTLSRWPNGGALSGIAIDPQAALREYLEMYYRLGRAGKALDRFGVVEFATTIAPGLRDVLLTGKVYEAARRRGTAGRLAYDAIVLDAPPTGRITRFLDVNREVAGLAKVGPIRSQADSITALLRSPGTAVHVVTTLEEMPVQETLDGVAELSAAGLPVGHIVVNLVRQSPLSSAARDALASDGVQAAAIEAVLPGAGLVATPALAKGLLSEGFDHVQRLGLQDEQRARLTDNDLPRVELPYLSAGIDTAALHSLGGELIGSGLA